ncbi:hypothetical protein MNB_SV-6-1105 [hydrothermal vent metagenome]|uniref:Uncharacterized protein n=1 Tax=hydrothermal vent metagenome TaxID=652676 RepID=A0A1W1BZL4_9ZZZZ
MLKLESLVWLVIGLSLSSLTTIYYPALNKPIFYISLALLMVILWRYFWRVVSQDDFTPKSKAFKKLQKIQKKREKIDTAKHHYINDQIEYIDRVWGYTKEQRRVIDRFLDQRAYSHIYNRLSASLLPQLITMIELCIKREKRGCKREVSKRIKEIYLLMKEELSKKKSQTQESFETSVEVFDRLID